MSGHVARRPRNMETRTKTILFSIAVIIAIVVVLRLLGLF